MASRAGRGLSERRMLTATMTRTRTRTRTSIRQIGRCGKRLASRAGRGLLGEGAVSLSGGNNGTHHLLVLMVQDDPRWFKVVPRWFKVVQDVP